MKSKLDIRVGDIVQPKPMRVTAFREGDTDAIYCEVVDGTLIGGQPAQEYLWVGSVHHIISRAETLEDEVARLRAENAGLRNDVKAAEAAYEAELAKAEAKGYIQWSGGEPPVYSHVHVSVRLRDGSFTNRLASRIDWSWGEDEHPGDVMSYMVLPS